MSVQNDISVTVLNFSVTGTSDSVSY